MTSFDLKFLFTSVPVGETINEILEILFPYGDCLTVLTKFFLNKFWTWPCGTRPLSLTVVPKDRWKGWLWAIHSALFSLTFLRTPWRSLFFRFLSPKFLPLIFKHGFNSDMFLECFNAQHPSIRFTVEKETKISLVFRFMTDWKYSLLSYAYT